MSITLSDILIDLYCSSSIAYSFLCKYSNKIHTYENIILLSNQLDEALGGQQ